MKYRRMLSLLLAVLMALLLTACTVEIPGIGTLNIKEDDSQPAVDTEINSAEADSTEPGWTDGEEEELVEPGCYDETVDVLREEMTQSSATCPMGIAYIGDAAGGLKDLKTPVWRWADKMAPDLCTKYRFILSIPDKCVVGAGGSLFCVVPRDRNASVAVNHLRWSEHGREVDQVLYRSDRGDPILLFACADMGTSAYPDTQVVIMNEGEEAVEWYPVFGMVSLPLDTYDGSELGYDFTVYDEDVGWTSPTEEQLSRATWVWDDYTESYAYSMLHLNTDGSAEFIWWNGEDNEPEQEIYQGTWKLRHDKGLLHLALTRTGGAMYREGERTLRIEDDFPVQVPMGFEDYMVLHLDKGQRGGLLPVQKPSEPLLYMTAMTD